MSGAFAEALDKKITAFVRRSLSQEPAEDEFNALALNIFAYQFAHNMMYRMYCMRRDRTPDRIEHWREIPPIPTASFKAGPLCCFPPQNAVRVFETSGTTRGRSGKHYFDSLALYNENALPNFSRCLLPDGAALPMRILMPHPDQAPQSSLAHMLKAAADAFSSGTDWLIKNNTLLVDQLLADLELAQESGQARFLLGPAFSFVHVFDAMTARGSRVSLPAGSRIMETGGYKGKSRELKKPEFLRRAMELLGVPATHVINEYGMTELSSQMYDNTLREHIRGRAVDAPVKIPPPWVRVEIIDPKSESSLPDGELGVIAVWDLANRGSVMAVQTEDIGRKRLSRERLGREREGGFEVMGRVQGAGPRGCSIAVDEMLTAGS